MTVHQIDDILSPAIDSWTPINLNRLPETPPIQPNLGNTQLIYPGKRHVFSGPPESAKTLAAYCVLIQIARTGGTGILIDFEMGAYDARQRLRELGATPTELDQIHYIEPDERSTPARITLLVELEPTLVVIDAAAGAYTLEGFDDNKRLEVERFSDSYIKPFWRKQIATILIDHVVKDAEHRGRYQIGSERKLGVLDVHYGFDIIQPISRGTSGKYKILTHKDRAGYMRRGHLADFKIESDPDTHQMAWTFTEPIGETDDQGNFRRTGYMERASIQLELADEPLPKNELARRVGGTKDYVLDAAATLIREGFVTATDGPNRSKLLESIRAYREDDPACNPVENPGSTVVREWFGSGSDTTMLSGGSVVRPPYGVDTTRPPTHTPTEPHGWFDDNGTFIDSELAYLESIAYDPDEEH